MSEIQAVPESHLDLTKASTGVLSTVGPSGRPQSTAVWFVLDDDGIIRTSLTTDRQKTKNMAARPKATMFVLDPANPMRTLELRCDVAIIEDPGLELMDRVIRSYGADPETFPAPRENRVGIEMTPRRVVAQG